MSKCYCAMELSFIVGCGQDTSLSRVSSPTADARRDQPAPAPTITAVNPNPIPGTTGLHAVTIVGTNFVDKPTVIATWGVAGGGSGAVDPSRVTFVSSAQLTVMVRVAIAPDTGSIRVVNPDGQTANAYAFSISPPLPTITGVNPNPVPGTLGVHSVTITGTDFVNKPTVINTWQVLGGGSGPSIRRA